VLEKRHFYMLCVKFEKEFVGHLKGRFFLRDRWDGDEFAFSCGLIVCLKPLKLFYRATL